MATYRNRSIERCVLELYRGLPKNLVQFPLDIMKAVVALGNCKVITYQEAAVYHSASVDEVIAYCKSRKGCTFKVQGEDSYIIMYNDAEDITPGEKRFTLGHEVAHIRLGHMTMLESYGIYHSSYLDYDEYFEREAKYFAACLLCPMPVLSVAKPRTTWSIQKVFGVSRRAAEITLGNYKAYDKSYHVQWHNDVVNLFGTHCKEVMVSTYQRDCWIITKSWGVTEAVPEQGQGKYISPYMMRKVLRAVMGTKPPKPKVEIIISPNLYERVVLDWI